MSSPRVLIVDDEPALADSLRLAFDAKGWEVETAETVDDALARLKTAKFDLIVTDKNLPGRTGLELVREVRASGDDRTAVLVMTGYSSPESAAEALNLDVDAYLEKPFDSIFSPVDHGVAAVARRTRMHAAPASEAPPKIRVIVAAVTRDGREKLIAPIERERCTILEADSEGSLDAALGPGADAVVIDAVSFGDALESLAARAASRAPLATHVVVYDTQHTLALAILQRLIEHGVKGLFDERAYARTINELLEKVRVKKSVLAGLPGP